MNVKIISAGAGSGKTYRLTSELVDYLKSGEVRPSGVIATTFTKKAAAELHERVRTRLIEEGMSDKANELGHALIGTVHSLGVKLLSRFALEAGISPNVDIIAEEDQQLFFSQSMATAMTNEKVSRIEELAGRLSLSTGERGNTDWRRMLIDITELARANDFGTEQLERSKQKSISEFERFLKAADEDAQYEPLTAEQWDARLAELLKTTIERVHQNEDQTKKTSGVIAYFESVLHKLNRGEALKWAEWAKISKASVGTKSRDDVEELIAFARAHYLHPGFKKDISDFISEMFDLALAALTEYANFKMQRGLIDYTDMEVLVRHLLDREDVQAILKEELDLLMVDEFQDTNPLQLDIFLKLSRLARQSVWVGDPKQSIYGFRGAEPALIQAIIEDQGGLDPENIQPHSWRSREGLVNFSNAVFTAAFHELPAEQVALTAKRTRAQEPPGTGVPVVIWDLGAEDPPPRMRQDLMYQFIASAIAEMLQDAPLVLPKGENQWRKAVPGDVAVLCRTNSVCQAVAEALHSAGLKASVARVGLLETAEAKLLTACLRLVLNKYDSLSKAELWYLSADQNIEHIVQNRLDHLEAIQNGASEAEWGSEVEVIAKINQLRPQIGDLSPSELVQLLLDELDLRRIIIRWGNPELRLSNVEEFVKNTQDYEDACNRRNAAASLAGFLMWLNELAANELDGQGAADTPDAVKVLTYHKSKGLEYPIVVCNNLWQPLRANLWGTSIVREDPRIDLNNPLDGRWLRLWVNPYDKQSRQTILADRLGGSAAQAQEIERAIAEEKRLLYVGFTRARDYLVLASSAGHSPQWLDRVIHLPEQKSNSLQLLQSGELSWAGQPIELATRQLKFDTERAVVEQAQPEAFLYFDRPSGKTEHEEYFFDLSGWKKGFAVESEGQYAPALEGFGEQEAAALTQLFRSVRLEYPESVVEGLIEDQLRLLPALKSLVSKQDLMNRLNAFRNLVADKLGGQLEYLLPIDGGMDGKQFQLEVDLVAKMDKRMAITRHCSLPAGAKAKDRLFILETAKLHLCKLAVSDLYQVSSCLTFLHSPLSGQLLRIEYEDDHSSS